MSWHFLDAHDHGGIDGRFMEAEHWTSHDDWPAEWIDVTVKVYPRFASVPLPVRPWAPRLTLKDALAQRRSTRESGEAVPLEDISTVLHESLRVWPTPENPGARRAYPSAGARFPVETYLLWNGDDAPGAGAYHYRPMDHHLEKMQEGRMDTHLRSIFGHEWIAQSRCVILLAGAFGRSAVKYGERSYRFTLLEAGHMMQNLLLVSADLGVSAAPVGGFADDRITRLLDLGRTDERVLYGLVIP